MGLEEHRTESGIEVRPIYRPEDLGEHFDYSEKLGDPGEYPYTRGVYPNMYRGRPWTMRQYAGFGTARETNARFKYLIEHGQTGLSVAFDLPTQMGRDSDHALALGEVGKVGVAIDSLLDMRDLFEGIPLGGVSTSMTINATAAILLLLYSLVAEEQGVEAEDVKGTTQNDILKEYLARGTYIYPPEPSMRITTDNDLLQEVPKYRAARRMWAAVMKDRFGATDERSLKTRFHTQPAGSSLTAQQAENNVVRTTMQA